MLPLPWGDTRSSNSAFDLPDGKTSCQYPSQTYIPPFNTIRLSHAELGVTHLARARAFYVDTLGLQVTDESADAIYLRAMEERGHHCLILRRVDVAAAWPLGFKVFDEECLDRAASFLAGKNLPVELVERPYQTRTLVTCDPHGVPLELYCTVDRFSSIHQQYALYRGVKPLPIDHFNCFSPDVDASVAFYNEIGFRVPEYTEDADSGRLWAAWTHRKGTVLDIAFTNGTGPHLHHTAFWVPNPMSIIDLLDLMATTGWVGQIEHGPDRHGISNASFLYVRDPDGHRIEIYCSDYQTLDPDLEPIKWDLLDPQRQTLWGAPAPRSWFEEGSLFAGVKTRPATLAAQHIIAP